MFKDEYNSSANAALAKVSLLNKNPIGYFILSMLAGIYVGFGSILIFTISGQLEGAPYTKIIMGAAFSVALSLVIMAGAELFTGNNLVMMSGIMKKTISTSDAIKLWIICWIGNLAGSILLSFLFYGTGLLSGATAEAIATASLAKMNASGSSLFFKAILCNFLVCLAVWCGIKLKSESGKLIMIFMCLFIFNVAGFEHSVANMTTLTCALINTSGMAITITGWIYNLTIVTVGNMIGGICLVALPYFVASKE